MKNKKKNREHSSSPVSQSQPTLEPSTPAAVEERLEKSINSCIATISGAPMDQLTRKQVHVGLEAVILRGERMAAKNDWTLERADLHLQYKDKENNTIMVNTDLDLANQVRKCQLLYGPVMPKGVTVPIAPPENETTLPTKKGKK